MKGKLTEPACDCKEKKRRKMPPWATGRFSGFGCWQPRLYLSSLGVYLNWKKMEDVYIIYTYLYIIILYYTIYILYIYILYSTWGPSEVDSFAWQLPRFELPSTTRWMRSILTSASLAKERLRSSGSARSARREANRISGRKDAPSSGAERFGGFGLNIEVFQHKLAIFLGIPGPQSHW